MCLTNGVVLSGHRPPSGETRELCGHRLRGGQPRCLLVIERKLHRLHPGDTNTNDTCSRTPELIVGVCPLISAHSTVNCTGRSRPLTQALNHAETVRLLASIELAAYACKQAMADPSLHSAIRRRIARVIKDDRRRRHKRRKDQDAMVAAFARTGLVDSGSGSNSNSNSNAAPSAYAPSFPSAASAPPPAEPVPVPAPVPMPIPEPAMHAAPGQAPGGLYMGMQPEL